MKNRWVVTVDNLDGQSFDDFLEEFVDEMEDGIGGIGGDYKKLSPATTAILKSDESTKRIKEFVRDRLDYSKGRATITQISGPTKYVGKVWDIDMSFDGLWATN